ncbi:MAG: regulatory iron-sulfur-containing complex subunit RicT [Propionibacteriaceae bacterium]|nr:regulatory iron-sulfur-containing complex subunit RicT [Propionibacteriaceae bacterium]
MSKVMAVTFEEHGRLHYLDPGEEDHAVGDWVLYPTEDGPEVARVVWAPEEAHTDAPLPRCAGRASEADLRRDEARRERRRHIQQVAAERIAAHGLPMKVMAADCVEGKEPRDQVAVVYYTAPGRVDFRALVGDLARALGARVDLRQVASRDTARLAGGVGMCGRELCCTLFLDEVEPVSMRLARSQNLAGNPLQIQGVCGKLKCCLAYEHPLYVDFLKRAPAIGDRVAGGTVVAHHVPTDEVSVRGPEGVRRCPLTSVCTSYKARAERDRALGKEC